MASDKTPQRVRPPSTNRSRSPRADAVNGAAGGSSTSGSSWLALALLVAFKETDDPGVGVDGSVWSAHVSLLEAPPYERVGPVGEGHLAGRPRERGSAVEHVWHEAQPRGPVGRLPVDAEEQGARRRR